MQLQFRVAAFFLMFGCTNQEIKMNITSITHHEDDQGKITRLAAELSYNDKEATVYFVLDNGFDSNSVNQRSLRNMLNELAQAVLVHT